MTENEFFAYLAGFIDADGSIGIVTVAKSKTYVVQICACNCNRTPIDMLQQRFGGKVRTRDWKNKKWKINYEWKLTSLKAISVIEKILPYLKIKNEQAQIAIEAQLLKQKYTPCFLRWHQDVKAIRDEELETLKLRCKKLNHRGREAA
jgi:hypothetical protein